MTIKKFNTEGVLLIANATQCKNYYTEKEFDYAYPEGLSALILKGLVHIITTSETINRLDFVVDKTKIDTDKWKHAESYNYLNVEKDDKILLISHGAFTRMCQSWGESDKANAWDIRMLELQKKILATNGIEKTVTLDSVVEARIKLRNEDEAKLFQQSPEILLEPGFYEINIYCKPKQQFTFLFTKTDAVDLDRITFKPLEIYE